MIVSHHHLQQNYYHDNSNDQENIYRPNGTRVLHNPYLLELSWFGWYNGEGNHGGNGSRTRWVSFLFLVNIFQGDHDFYFTFICL